MNTQNNQYYTNINDNGNKIDIQLGCRIVGYQFLWDFNDNKYYKTYAELRRFVLEKTIYDSNSEKLTGVEFFNMATHWESDKELSWPDGYRMLDGLNVKKIAKVYIDCNYTQYLRSEIICDSDDDCLQFTK
jgi:hypothetical protein